MAETSMLRYVSNFDLSHGCGIVGIIRKCNKILPELALEMPVSY